MELILDNRFCEMTNEELIMVDGGGWKAFCAALGGTLLIGFSPVIGVTTGPSNGFKAIKNGTKLIDYACKHA